MTSNPYKSPRQAEPKRPIKWKSVFFFALGAAALGFVAVLIVWSLHPSEVIDERAPSADFYGLLLRLHGFFGLEMYASVAVAIFALIRWRTSRE